MKIALLNLPFDNNYGGNLQRYALIKVLQDMGVEVEHINLRTSYSPSLPRQLGRWLKRLFKLIRGEHVDFLYEKHMRRLQSINNSYAEEFYAKYIPHTKEVNSENDIKRMAWDKYDVVIVGSDQVWRYDMAEYSIGVNNFFLSFLTDTNIRRVGYSISLGSYKDKNIGKYKALSYLYKQFYAVSFRELAALEYIGKVGWTPPTPAVTLDPTLLLKDEDYINYFSLNKTDEKYAFCYILDCSESSNESISEIVSTLQLSQRKCSLNGKELLPVLDWVANIMNATAVITDSYHGVVFSILFSKRLFFIGNERRGNDRIFSLFEALHISLNGRMVEYHSDTQRKIAELRNESLDFLKTSIYGIQESFKN